MRVAGEDCRRCSQTMHERGREKRGGPYHIRASLRSCIDEKTLKSGPKRGNGEREGDVLTVLQVQSQ